nr:major facilitator superfamily transporter [Candidatus Pantoea persica]
MLGTICCGMSGALTIVAVLCRDWPLLSLLLLAVGRLFLGVGESFSSTGSTRWGMNIVGPLQTARVLSWNGVATYLAMAIGAPLGIMLNQGMGISGFAGLVALMDMLGYLLASRKLAVAVNTASAFRFTASFRASGCSASRSASAPSASALSPPLLPSTSPAATGAAPPLRCRCLALALCCFAYSSAAPLRASAG